MSRKAGTRQSFEELERYWYQRLKEEDFVDIENTRLKARPLKRWHSFDLLDERRQKQRVQALEYQRAAEAFFHHPRFPEVCESVAAHGNCGVNEKVAATIFELSLEGLSHRQIASELGVSKTCVTNTLSKLHAWRRLL